jgi:hypothetical protein
MSESKFLINEQVSHRKHFEVENLGTQLCTESCELSILVLVKDRHRLRIVVLQGFSLFEKRNSPVWVLVPVMLIGVV